MLLIVINYIVIVNLTIIPKTSNKYQIIIIFFRSGVIPREFEEEIRISLHTVALLVI